MPSFVLRPADRCDIDALLAAAQERLAALGAERFDAMVLDKNELGQKAWAAAGYQPQPEWSRWVRPR